MDDLGVYTPILENFHIICRYILSILENFRYILYFLI